MLVTRRNRGGKDAGLVKAGLRPTEDHHLRSEVGQLNGGRAPDAGSSTGDDGDAIVQAAGSKRAGGIGHAGTLARDLDARINLTLASD